MKRVMHISLDSGSCASSNPLYLSQKMQKGTWVAVAFNMSIFIIDGYKSMLRIIHNLSKQNGFADLGEASDGVFGLKTLRQKKYDLLISVWNMSPMAGIELRKEGRLDEVGRSVPLLMVIAESKSENLIMAKKSGVNNYILNLFNALTFCNNITVEID